MSFWLLTLWVNTARNKLQAHKEEPIFQERPRFGSSTRKRNCKAQPLPHPTHASYKWGIRKIPFICADSFPALGFSYLSLIWLINLFMETCYPHRNNCLFQPLICKERVSPKEGGSEKGYVRGVSAERGKSLMKQCFPIFFNGLPCPWCDFFLTPSHLYLCHLGSLTSLHCLSPDKVKSFVSSDYLNVHMQNVLSSLWDANGDDPLLLV